MRFSGLQMYKLTGSLTRLYTIILGKQLLTYLLVYLFELISALYLTLFPNLPVGYFLSYQTVSLSPSKELWCLVRCVIEFGQRFLDTKEIHIY